MVMLKGYIDIGFFFSDPKNI